MARAAAHEAEPARATRRPPAVGPWSAPPAQLRLKRGELHVWLADLACAGGELAAALDGDERRRAQRSVDPRAGELWARSRGVLRALLALYLGCEAAAVPIAVEDGGKPVLGLGEAARGPGSRLATATRGAARAAERLCFNLSHSRELALYAVCAGAEVGVDIETGSQGLDVVRLAARAFGAAEAERLAALEPPLRAQEFLRLWTRREAALKWAGAGFAGAARAPAGLEPRWIAELPAPRGAAAAVACARTPRRVLCLTWPPEPG